MSAHGSGGNPPKKGSDGDKLAAFVGSMSLASPQPQQSSTAPAGPTTSPPANTPRDPLGAGYVTKMKAVEH